MGQGNDKGLGRLLRALEASPDVSLRHVWSALTTEERAAALSAWLGQAEAADAREQRENRQLLVGAVANGLRGFRPSTVLSWPVSRLCAEASRLGDIDSRKVLEGVVRQHHIPLFGRLQAPLFDAIGVRHRDGALLDGVEESLKAIDADAVRLGALAAWRAQPTREMAIYLLSLVTMYPREWAALAPVLPGLAKDLIAGIAPSTPSNNGPSAVAEHAAGLYEASPTPEPKDVTTATGEWRAPKRPLVAGETAKLSALDDQLILRIVASVQGITDAPDEHELEIILDELVHLSASRHQSYFHLGLNDSMRRRGVISDFPASNRSRMRWYLAGYVSGLSRRTASEELLALFEELPDVRELGDTGQGPSALAAPILAGALIEGDLSSALDLFLSGATLLRNRDLAQMVLEYAADLTKSERFAEALPLLEKLWTTLTTERGVDAGFRASLSRRLAQCLREQDQLEAARDLLLGLVESEDDEHRAMALADLGLIEAGFRRLADLRLPATSEEATAISEALERGWSRFSEGELLDVSTSSHARYCKGMAELTRREYAKAEAHLTAAIQAFDQEQSRYAPGGLLRRAHFHLAVARCANLESNKVRLEHAAEYIVEALKAGERLPERYAGEVIAGLSLRSDAGTIVLIERLLEIGGTTLLDRLRYDENVQTSTVVAEAFSTRSKAKGRTSDERAHDCRTALAMFLLQRDFDRADDTLAQLEDLAFDGADAVEFCSLLEGNRNLRAVWEQEEIDDALVAQLEGLGDYGRAAHLLIARFHRVVASARPEAHGRALDILERLGSYPNRDEFGIAQLRVRLEGSGLVPESIPSTPPPRGVTVLVVGGNETQRQYDEPISQDYRERAKWLEVEFMHTGWNSNWGDYVDEFERRVERADAVVFIYLMRTQLGRTLRQRCGRKPWRGCGGKGRAAIQRAIEAAAAAGLQ